MDGSCGSRWPGTEDPLIPTTVVVVAAAAAAAVEEDGEAEEGLPGGTAGMDAEAEGTNEHITASWIASFSWLHALRYQTPLKNGVF